MPGSQIQYHLNVFIINIRLGICSTKQTSPQEMDSWSILLVTATLTNNISTIYAVRKLFDAYSWNAVGKVKNTQLYNFHLVPLFQSLHLCGHLCGSHADMQPCPTFFHVVLRMFTSETPATDIQLWESSNCIPLFKKFCKWINRHAWLFLVSMSRVELTAIT